MFVCVRDCYAPTSPHDNGNRRFYRVGEELPWSPCKHFEPVEERPEPKAPTYEEMGSEELKQMCLQRGIDPGARPTLKKMRALLEENDLEQKEAAADKSE